VARIEHHLHSLLQHDDKVSGDSDVDVMMSVDAELFSEEPERCILYYLAGYIAHKLCKFTPCAECKESLINNGGSSEDDKLVSLKTRGGLKMPSQALTRLLTVVEHSVQVHAVKPKASAYSDILNSTLSSDDLSTSMIGCAAHCCSLTARCVHFYITTRLFFIRKAINRNRSSNQQKQKLSKLSKLT